MEIKCPWCQSTKVFDTGTYIISQSGVKSQIYRCLNNKCTGVDPKHMFAVKNGQ